MHVGTESRRLDRDAVRRLRDELDDALTSRREFLHTACVHRDDGSYVVERRGADSAGHRKVFSTPEACRRMYDRLPETFAAEDVTATGVTGGRRHLLVRHFAEHPAYDCELTARQPLTVRKAEDVDSLSASDQRPVGAEVSTEAGDLPTVQPADGTERSDRQWFAR